MATILTDHIKRLMSQDTFEMDDESLNKDLICDICKKIMIYAYQSYCGCHYCRGCIATFLTDEKKYCPGGKQECKEELLVLENNVALNPILNKKIMRMKVHCPNKPCPCITELTQIEEHLRVCTQQSMKCPFSLIGCENEKASNENLLVHLHDDVGTHSQLLIELINNLKNEVNGLKEDFAMSKLELATSRKESREKEVQMEELKKEMEEMRKCMIKPETGVEHLGGEFEKRESAATVNQSMKDVRTRVDKLAETVSILNVGTNTKVAVGLLSFIVDNFSARKTAEEAVFSPYFYSHTNGYKLRLQVHPGGVDDARGTHLSVSLVICKGEYDDVLPWPCRNVFAIRMTNQRDGRTHTRETHHFATWLETYYFDRPICQDNRGYGYNKFVSHKDLKSVVGLVVEDSVIIRCAVSAPP